MPQLSPEIFDSLTMREAADIIMVSYISYNIQLDAPQVS